MSAYRINRLVWIVLVGAGVVIGGCNVFDGFSTEPTTVDALLADARSALTEGNDARAVRLLERAFAKDSTDVRVRVELGNALFSEHGLDGFSLRDAAEHLGASPDSTESSETYSLQSGRTQRVCTDGAQPNAFPDRFAAIPVEADPLQAWVSKEPVVERVQRLVVEGAIHRGSAFEAAPLGLRQKGLLVGAVAEVAGKVIEVHEVFVSRGGMLYLDQGRQSGRALLACTETEIELERTHEALCGLNRAAGQGLQWLRERERLSGSEQESVLAGRLESVVDVAGARVNCPVASREPSLGVSMQGDTP